MHIREEIKKSVLKALKFLDYRGDFSVKVLKSQKSTFGDYFVSVAMEVAKREKEDPMEVAEKIKGKIRGKYFEKIEVMNPGFINFFISKEYIWKEIIEVMRKGKNFGKFPRKKEKVLIEVVSTFASPLTIESGRSSFYGDVLANVFRSFGCKVRKACYASEYEKQILFLGHSVLKDKEAEYIGEYIDRLHKKVKGKDAFVVGKKSAKIIINDMIKKTFKKLNIKFDEMFLDSSLYSGKEIDKIIDLLRDEGLTYEQEGAEWFMSKALGDERDRVIIKSNKDKTYLLGDIAYHKYEFEKNKFDKIVNIWGPDHFADAPGLIAGSEAMLHINKLEVVALQPVTIFKDDRAVRESKRLETSIAMDDLLDILPTNTIRFLFLLNSSDSQLNFDLDIAGEKSEKNPMYYIQNTYTTISNILKNSGRILSIGKIKDIELLDSKKELDLMKQILRFTEVIEDTAHDHEVHRLSQYVIDLANIFHKFYNHCPVLTGDRKLSDARLGLIVVTKTVLKNALDLMGVSVSEKMSH